MILFVKIITRKSTETYSGSSEWGCYDQLRQHIKKQRHYFANKGLSCQTYGFSSSHVWMESWTIKRAEHQRIDAFELWCWRRLLSSLDSKKIKPVNLKGNQSLIFIVRTDTEAEATILCPPDGKSWLTGKDPDAGKDWRWEEKGITEDEMVGWHHWLKGHEFEQALGGGEWQGTPAFCSPQVHKESDTAEWLNNHNPSRLVVMRVFSYAFLYILAMFSYLEIAMYLGSRDSI